VTIASTKNQNGVPDLSEHRIMTVRKAERNRLNGKRRRKGSSSPLTFRPTSDHRGLGGLGDHCNNEEGRARKELRGRSSPGPALQKWSRSSYGQREDKKVVGNLDGWRPSTSQSVRNRTAAVLGLAPISAGGMREGRVCSRDHAL